MSKKRKLTEFGIIKLNEKCSAILQNKLPSKLKDPGSLKIPSSIGNDSTVNYLCDSGTSINLIYFWSTIISLQLVDRSIKYPWRVVENMLIKVGKFIFPVDFVIVDIDEPWDASLLILGRSFLSTSWAIMDFEAGKLTLRMDDEQEKFKIYIIVKKSSHEENSRKV